MNIKLQSDYSLRTVSDAFVTFLYAAAVHLIIARFVEEKPEQLSAQMSALVFFLILYMFSDWLGRVRLPWLLPASDEIGVGKQLWKTFLEVSGLFFLLFAWLALIEKSHLEWSESFWLGPLNPNRAFAIFLVATFLWNMLMLAVMKHMSWLDLARLGMSGTAIDSEKIEIYAKSFLQFREKMERWAKKTRKTGSDNFFWNLFIEFISLLPEAVVRPITQVVALHIAWASIIAGAVILLTDIYYQHEPMVIMLREVLPRLSRYWPIVSSLGLFVLSLFLIRVTSNYKRICSTLFRESDFADAPGLLEKLQKEQDPLSRYLLSKGSAGLPQQAEGQDVPGSPPDACQSLINVLNQALDDPELFEEQRFVQVYLRPDTQRLLAQKGNDVDVRRRNRLLLQDAYPDEIFESKTWRDKFALAAYYGITWVFYIVGFCSFVFLAAQFSLYLLDTAHPSYWVIGAGSLAFLSFVFGVGSSKEKPLRKFYMRFGGSAVAMVLLTVYLMLEPRTLMILVAVQQVLVNAFLQFAASERRIVIKVAPKRVTLVGRAQQQFVAGVFGTDERHVRWEATFGVVDSSGLYAPPSFPGTFKVRAVWAEDENQFAEATVIVPD